MSYIDIHSRTTRPTQWSTAAMMLRILADKSACRRARGIEYAMLNARLALASVSLWDAMDGLSDAVDDDDVVDVLLEFARRWPARRLPHPCRIGGRAAQIARRALDRDAESIRARRREDEPAAGTITRGAPGVTSVRAWADTLGIGRRGEVVVLDAAFGPDLTLLTSPPSILVWADQVIE